MLYVKVGRPGLESVFHVYVAYVAYNIRVSTPCTTRSLVQPDLLTGPCSRGFWGKIIQGEAWPPCRVRQLTP
jgi:hypothetical protein